MKKILSVILALTMLCVMLAACGDKDDTSGSPGDDASGGADIATGGDVELTVWCGDEADQAMTRQICDAFIEANKDKANITINIGVQSEQNAREVILADPLAAADVFVFADDQLHDLYVAGALQEVVVNTDAIKSRNAAASVDAASVDGKLYAYPLTADNGYFMFYDKSYFSEDDVKSIDKMLEVAAAAGKQITMDYGSGWYLYAFFKGAGLEAYLKDDGSNFCNWNESPGTAVVQAAMDIAAHPGFISLGDGEFVTGIKDGSIIAGINGPWNANEAKEAWGDNYAATKLPTFTVNGQQMQMSSFSGFKLVGVNAFSENTGWAMEFADFITNEENQLLRFRERNQGPSNSNASTNPEVLADPALAALAAQAAFATPQRIGGNYWDPAAALGQIMVQGNPDGTDLQEMLDATVAGITSPPG